MADNTAAAPPGQDNAAGGGGFSGILKQAAFAFLASRAVSYLFAGKSTFSPPAPPVSVSTSDTQSTGPASPANSVPSAPSTPAQQEPPLHPLWPPKTLLDFHLTLSPESDPSNVSPHDPRFPSVTWEGVELGAASKWSRVWETEWDVPESVQHNGSFFLDAFVTRAGHGVEEDEEGEVLHVRKALTRYYPQKRVKIVKNLLSGEPAHTAEKDGEPVVEAEETEEERKARPIVSFYHPNVTLELVTESGPLAYGTLPPPVKQHVHLARNGARTFDSKQTYFPIVFPNDFWLLSSHMFPLNSSTTRVPLRVELKPTSHFKFQMLSTMDDAFTKQSAATGGGRGELDEIKRILIETNPTLLITTVVVSVLHMLFEFLAFTSDVKHWRGKKELVGVSVRTILTNVFVQLVVLLYLVDQSEETNYMIIVSSGIGVAIEAWKITKAVDIRISPNPARPLFPYSLEIKDKHVLTEDELKTQEYDRLAFKWVGWGTTPFLVGWTIYSLLYQPHKSWYSFTVQTMYSFVGAFGFVQLVPQLIINYKLRSVAHIPMKAMGYKVLSTVIDDFFAFVIRMPLMHRIACFRDDLVFLILLYQMYIYRVDPNRENEYGQKLTEEEAKKLLEQQAKKGQEKVRSGKEETKKTQ
ncbi:cleft lip and palate associated transmembrane protein [Rhodotorula toruloides]|uniref:Cleft lip and palate associated transmembrane protein n=1 Tax=Rhodotorula toruloides TaxID=5286 RepID=A0A511KHI6_RHOTO|nr:cleft lip and palate associated transmembrane protein [Rhodotorula toruloides]